MGSVFEQAMGTTELQAVFKPGVQHEPLAPTWFSKRASERAA
jgi:hypothetical protein